MRAAGSAQSAQLPEDAEQVELLPVLDQPPVPDAVNMDARHRNQAASGRHACEVPGMGSGSAPSRDDLVAFGHLIMDGHHEGGERGVRRLHCGRVGVGSGVGTAGDMTHEGGVEQLREQIAVTAGEDLIVVAAYQRLVLRQSHVDMLAPRSRRCKHALWKVTIPSCTPDDGGGSTPSGLATPRMTGRHPVGGMCARSRDRMARNKYAGCARYRAGGASAAHCGITPARMRVPARSPPPLRHKVGQ